MRIYVFLLITVCTCFAKDSLVDNFQISSHNIQLNGKEITYSTSVGILPVKNNCSGASADIFFVSYTIDTEGREDRPITFLFNGGPGSASVFLHLSAFGPKKIDFEDKSSKGLSHYKLIENDQSLLEYSDLVFIDPVGTGFSENSKEKKMDSFYSVEGDAQAIGDFICKYLTTFDRWLSHKYIVGESYGTIRAVLTGEYLQDDFGVYLDGIALISPVIKASHLPDYYNKQEQVSFALVLPSFCAAAWYHGLLPADIQEKDLLELLTEVKSFALDEYMLSLIKGDTLSSFEREKTVELLSRYTGISKDIIEKCNLKLDMETFALSLLPIDKTTDLSYIVGYHDARCIGYSKRGKEDSENPSLSNFLGSYSSIANDYIRNELGYYSKSPYLIFNMKANCKWNYEKDGQKDFKNLDLSDDIRHLFMVNPKLKIFVASGFYDLVTPFTAAEFDINHLHLPSTLEGQIKFRAYEGGHMMYMNKSVHEKLTSDLISMYSY